MGKHRAPVSETQAAWDDYEAIIEKLDRTAFFVILFVALVCIGVAIGALA